MAPGDRAPDFALPAVNGTDTVSLDQYRGRSPVFLALMLGLWCPFCRRQLVQLGKFEVKLKTLGIETVAVVATEPENARLYFKFRPTQLRLASDPDLSTHRAYRVPKPEPTPELLQAMAETKINPFGDLPEPLPVEEVGKLMQQRDGYAYTTTDQAEVARQWPQLKALFLIDRDGVVRWADIECATEGMAGLGKLPSEEVILDAARACVA
jgi:peroxiredoxin